MSALRVSGLEVSLGGTRVLDGIDLEVAPGEAVALLGPSGSGKTTLLGTVAGFVVPDAGTVSLGGEVVSGGGRSVPPEARSVGFVFQNYALWPHLSAAETVAYPLLRAGAAAGEAREEAARLLDLMGLGGLAARRPAEMSGGQQQRVGVARALARRARLYLLDEPTAHLDSALRTDLQAEIAARMTADGAAALYATHDAAEAMAVAGRVVVVREGRIVQQGTPAEVYARPADVWAARLTGPAWEIDGAAAGVAAGRVLVRPEWVEPGEGMAATVRHAWFRGPHTDYRLDTPAGEMAMRRPGPPEWRPGDAITVTVARWSETALG
ncbi:MAG: ABC transporter ATP-binding protein [Actinobacteria bacterium]|nr:ABC transporter ATP-binding protein [Actinomycetota bacterium]